MTVWVATVADGRIESLGLDLAPAPPRLRPWESTLVLLTAWLFIASAAASARSGALVIAVASIAGSVLAMTAILTLSDSESAYAAGRTIPALLVPVGVTLLLANRGDRWAHWAVGTSWVAGLTGLLAPLTRDARLVGHPPVRWSVTDSSALYRGLLATSEALTGLVLIAIVAFAVGWIHDANRWRRPPLWGVAGIATVWAAAAVSSSVDYIFGDGKWAGGPLTAATWSALAAIPVLVMFRLFADRWDSPELANLVIDLEADGAELQPAIARALDDPSLRFLTSRDGQVLEDDQGDVVDRHRVIDGRALTEIRTGSRLVGAIVHDSALKRNPGRLRAVAAAAGLALEVSRLNDQVTAQLDEVNASRARIVQANDDARRRLERDLHDGAQQRLVALGLELQRARRRVGSNATVEELAAQLDAATVEVRDALNEIRAVSKGARPALLAERGLAAAIDALVARAAVPVGVDLKTDRLPSSVEATAYYVIAEGLTNVAKHAEAASANVSLATNNGGVVVEIKDNGTGGATPSAGSGLEGLSDRVAASGGTLRITSDPSGTSLTATIPCG